MMYPAPAGVKGTVRPRANTQYTQGLPKAQNPPPSRLPYAYRADPVALDALGLDLTARAVFVLLLDNAKSKGWRSRLSNSTMGRILNRCPMTISRALGRLESRGLIRRDLAAGGRIRVAIHVVWEGVRREDLSAQASVRREDPTGSARASEGLGAAVELTRVGVQSEANRPNGASLEDEDRPPDGKAGADYLRACVAAARRGEPMPEPPLASSLTATRDLNSCPAPVARKPVSGPQDDTASVVHGIVSSLTASLTRDVLDVRRPGRSGRRPRR